MLPSPASLALPSSSVYPSMSDMDSRLLGERYREYMKGLIKRAERKGVFENEVRKIRVLIGRVKVLVDVRGGEGEGREVRY